MAEQTNTKTNPSQPDLLILLQNFSNLRTGQDQVLWSIIGSFWTTNSLLLVSIFATDSDDRLYVGVIISFVGICISWVWNRIQSRALSRIELYERSIMAIEKKLELEFEICSHLQANSEDYVKKVNKQSARFVMRQFSKIALWLWVIVFAGLIIYTIFFTS